MLNREKKLLLPIRGRDGDGLQTMVAAGDAGVLLIPEGILLDPALIGVAMGTPPRPERPMSRRKEDSEPRNGMRERL